MKPKTKAFADKLLADPKISPTQAYLDTHQTTNRTTATVEASKNLRKPNVRIYMNKHIKMAGTNIVDMASDKTIKAETRLKANQDILDRTVGKAIQRSINENTNINLNIEGSKELSEAFTAFLNGSTKQT